MPYVGLRGNNDTVGRCCKLSDNQGISLHTATQDLPGDAYQLEIEIEPVERSRNGVMVSQSASSGEA